HREAAGGAADRGRPDRAMGGFERDQEPDRRFPRGLPRAAKPPVFAREWSRRLAGARLLRPAAGGYAAHRIRRRGGTCGAGLGELRSGVASVVFAVAVAEPCGALPGGAGGRGVRGWVPLVFRTLPAAALALRLAGRAAGRGAVAAHDDGLRLVRTQ